MFFLLPRLFLISLILYNYDCKNIYNNQLNCLKCIEELGMGVTMLDNILECAPCEEGFFNDGTNFRCRKCRSCRHNMVKSCTPKTDTICEGDEQINKTVNIPSKGVDICTFFTFEELKSILNTREETNTHTDLPNSIGKNVEETNTNDLPKSNGKTKETNTHKDCPLWPYILCSVFTVLSFILGFSRAPSKKELRFRRWVKHCLGIRKENEKNSPTSSVDRESSSSVLEASKDSGKMEEHQAKDILDGPTVNIRNREQESLLDNKPDINDYITKSQNRRRCESDKTGQSETHSVQ